jgi:hypothetical protein
MWFKLEWSSYSRSTINKLDVGADSYAYEECCLLECGLEEVMDLMDVKREREREREGS